MVGFTCCVNYADMLALTYPFNRHFFKAFVVVTAPDDKRTKLFCRANGIKLVLSESYKQDGSTFNRAAMLNQAIEYCMKNYPDEWLVSMDADVIMDLVEDNLPVVGRVWPDDREHGKYAPWCLSTTRDPYYFYGPLDTQYIYGCPRKMITKRTSVTLENLRRPSAGEWFQYPYNLCAYLGYFQMFWKRTARNDESYKNVNNSDTAFLDNNFGINRARTLRNLVCYHLGPNGVNWDGRKSEEWK